MHVALHCRDEGLRPDASAAITTFVSAALVDKIQHLRPIQDSHDLAGVRVCGMRTGLPACATSVQISKITRQRDLAEWRLMRLYGKAAHSGAGRTAPGSASIP